MFVVEPQEIGFAKPGAWAYDSLSGLRVILLFILMEWRFLTNHGRALLCLARAPGLRHRDLALVLQITERSAQKIVGDLVKAGYVSSERVGRRNVYEVHTDRPLPLGLELNVGDLLAVLHLEEDPAGEAPARALHNR